jgi:hypothetical protein
LQVSLVERLYIYTAAVILICTAFFKFIEVLRHYGNLNARDPVFMFLKIWQALLAAVLLELTTCVVLFSRDRFQRLLPVFMLSCLFLLYRVALAWVGVGVRACHCLGSAPELFGLDTVMSNYLASIALGYLLLGSLALLVFPPLWPIAKAAMKLLKTVGTRFGIFVIGFVTTLFGLSPASLAANYQASGSLIREYVKPDRSTGTVSNWFRIVRADCSCRITAGAIRDPAIESFEYRCDGTNSSLLIKYSPDYTNLITAKPNDRQLTTKTNTEPARIANEATLMLNTGPVPEYGYGMISEVWLAYASACFYEASTNGRTEPVFSMGGGFREHHLTVKSEWKLTTSVPALLERMNDFSDGFRYNEQDGVVIKERLPGPFDKEHTNVVYSVLSWTNYGGLTLPYEWQVVQYKPDFQTGQLEPQVTTRGYTDSVETSDDQGTDFAPFAPKNTRVIDSTLEAQGVPFGSYDYVTTNGKLRTVAEMAQDRNFKWAVTDAEKVRTAPGKRMLVAILAVLLIVFPLVFLLHRNWRGNSKRTV